MSTDRNEALRLIEIASGYTGLTVDEANQAAALLRQQAERIAELEGEIADLHTTMFAAAVEIQEHWDAHCDAEGYGPANLMHRLERGIASQYGYDAKTLQRVEAQRDQLRAEVERLRVAMTVPTIEPNSQNWQGMDGAIAFHLIERHADSWADAGRMMREWLEANAIDQARTTHKDEG